MRRADDAVARVSLWRGKDVKVTSLSGGLTNENYLVETGGERYVMRIPGASTELLSIDRVNEVHNARAAASTGIGPAVLEHVPQADVMVLEFISGPTMSAKTLQTASMVRRMAESFKRLHAAPRFLKGLPPDRRSAQGPDSHRLSSVAAAPGRHRAGGPGWVAPQRPLSQRLALRELHRRRAMAASRRLRTEREQ